MKNPRVLVALMAILCLFVSCKDGTAEETATGTAPSVPPEAATQPSHAAPVEPPVSQAVIPTMLPEDGVQILLDDDGITVDGTAVSGDTAAAVYTAQDIVYYEAGRDFTYGEGTAQDAHTPEEAGAHTVVHITKPGIYTLSGKLSLGQIAVDLGSDAKKDPEAVVTLILSGVDITCQVAPAVIFYNVYECGNGSTETATRDVDTSAAGANVIIADGTQNTVNGAYVARIYEPDSVVLNEAKTEVEDADKLHKYDAAFYSKRSMNVYGGKDGSGVLHIRAENEGLDSEMHLTIHGGNINIQSGNDGINTNEDGISVTAIHGGNLNIRVTGETGEGDGIDSNGWLVITGGSVTAVACSTSGDAGIDSDMGIHITGGRVLATGHMLDRIEDGGQNYAVFTFSQKQTGNETVLLKNADGAAVFEEKPENAYSILVYSSWDLTPGTYTLWQDGKQLAGQSGGMGMGGHGMMPPEGFTAPEGMELPEGFTAPEGGQPQQPDGTPPAEGNRHEKPDDGKGRPQRPEGGKPGFSGGNEISGERSTDFIIQKGGNMFSDIAYA